MTLLLLSPSLLFFSLFASRSKEQNVAKAIRLTRRKKKCKKKRQFSTRPFAHQDNKTRGLNTLRNDHPGIRTFWLSCFISWNKYWRKMAIWEYLIYLPLLFIALYFMLLLTNRITWKLKKKKILEQKESQKKHD